MNLFNKYLIISLPLSILGSACYAGGQAYSQGSVLLSVGTAQQSASKVTDTLQAQGYSNVQLQDDKRATSWSLGYRQAITDRWSVEAQYLDQGKSKSNLATTLPAGKTDVQAAQDIAKAQPTRGQGLSVTALYQQPLSQRWTMQAGAGAFAWHSKNEATVGTARYTAKDTGISPLLQVGLSYKVTPKVTLETTAQHFFMPHEDVDRVAVGVSLGF